MVVTRFIFALRCDKLQFTIFLILNDFHSLRGVPDDADEAADDNDVDTVVAFQVSTGSSEDKLTMTQEDLSAVEGQKWQLIVRYI